MTELGEQVECCDVVPGKSFQEMKISLNAYFQGYISNNPDILFAPFSVNNSNGQTCELYPSEYWSEGGPGIGIFCCAKIRMEEFQNFFGDMKEWDWICSLMNKGSGIGGILVGDCKEGGKVSGKARRTGTICLVNSFDKIFGDMNPNLYENFRKAPPEIVVEVLKKELDSKWNRIKMQAEDMTFLVNLMNYYVGCDPDYPQNWEVYTLLSAYFEQSSRGYEQALRIHEVLERRKSQESMDSNAMMSMIRQWIYENDRGVS